MSEGRIFVCRCEDVTLAEIEEVLALGLCDIEEIKRYTGLGTGPCQGKECLTPLTALLVNRKLISPDDAVPFTSRPPSEPVSLGTLATLPRRENGDLES